MKTLVQFIKELEAAAKEKGQGGLQVINPDGQDPQVERYEDSEINGWMIS